MDVRIAGVPECLDEYGARIKEIFGGFAVRESAARVPGARGSTCSRAMIRWS